jgi:excisionase family DNA binding protein
MVPKRFVARAIASCRNATERFSGRAARIGGAMHYVGTDDAQLCETCSRGRHCTLSSREAAERLNVTVETVRDLVKGGILRTVRVGITKRAHRRIPLFEIDRYVRAVTTPSQPEEDRLPTSLPHDLAVALTERRKSRLGP